MELTDYNRSFLVVNIWPLVCTVNPAIGREKDINEKSHVWLSYLSMSNSLGGITTHLCGKWGGHGETD